MAAFVIARCYAMHERGEHTVHNRRPSFFVLSFVRSFFDVLVASHVFTNAIRHHDRY